MQRPNGGIKQCPSVARGVLTPLIRHGWPKGNPLKAFFAQGTPWADCSLAFQAAHYYLRGFGD